MKINELKSIILEHASNVTKKEGQDAFDKGLVTYFKSKKIDATYHIYGRARDKSEIKEFNTHIKINLQDKKLEGIKCTCDEFKDFASSGYTLMCSHITATAYRFFDLVLKNNEKRKQKPEVKDMELQKIEEDNDIYKLIRKTENGNIYYEVQVISKGERFIVKPNDLRTFLERIQNRKIKFKFDNIEIITPIFNRDLPITFNLKEVKERIILTTHKQFPISLNPNKDVYYFKNELYLPSKKQIHNYAILYEKLKVHGEIVYKRDISNYNKLIFTLSEITENINIAESLKKFATNQLSPKLFIFEEENKIYCEVILNYGNKKINILNENNILDKFIRDYKKEEKLIMKIEKYGFVKMKNRFMFMGGDDKLFNILTEKGNGINSLGKVIFGKGLDGRKIYNSFSIEAYLYEINGYYEFKYSVGDLKREELKNALEVYRDGNKFYKTKSNNFLDFEDDGVRSFFNLFEVMNMEQSLEEDEIILETSKALYLYENIKKNGLGFFQSPKALDEIVNKLTNIDNSKLEIPKSFKGILREYQIKGFKWIKILSELGFGGILADEMGLGKTIQTIAFLLSEQYKKTIIICPTSLIYNWKEEIKKFAPSLKVLIVYGMERIRAKESIDEYDLILTTYGTLRMDVDIYEDIIFDYCIIDEGQNIKNALAKNAKVVKEIKAKIRFALTGTPIENNLSELWSIFDFIMPGYLYSKETFEEKFIQRREDNLENLKSLIKPFILRRTKKEVMKELPDKIEKKFLVEMTEAQKSVYSNYIKNVREIMKKNSDKKIEMFSYLTKLRQICLDPSLVIKHYNGGSGKFEIAIGLIKKHIDLGGKVLLFSQFTSVLNRIEERLNEEGIEFFNLDGKTKSKDRIKRVNEFNNNETVKVFLISLKAGGTGLNLTSANLVIHFDPWWNPAVENQATDRAHRIGQKNIVEVIRLVAKGTIEEKIILLQENKKELIDNILTDELQDSSLPGSLSKEDLIKLFDRD